MLRQGSACAGGGGGVTPCNPRPPLTTTMPSIRSIITDPDRLEPHPQNIKNHQINQAFGRTGLFPVVMMGGQTSEGLTPCSLHAELLSMSGPAHGDGPPGEGGRLAATYTQSISRKLGGNQEGEGNLICPPPPPLLLCLVLPKRHGGNATRKSPPSPTSERPRPTVYSQDPSPCSAIT